MKNIIHYFLLFFIFFDPPTNPATSAQTLPDKITLGEWQYKLFLNGKDIGTSVVSNKIENGNYISTAEYTMKIPKIIIITKDIVIETLDFKPVRLENYSRIEDDGNIQETSIISEFRGRNVDVSINGKKYSYTIDRDFILDGNYFIGKLIENKFKQDSKVTNYIYNPSVETNMPVKATTKVAGFENIKINGQEFRLLHLVQSIENMNDNIDLYIDDKGIMQKGIIQMLNLKIELIKINEI